MRITALGFVMPTTKPSRSIRCMPFGATEASSMRASACRSRNMRTPRKTM